jgi:Holliday junction resolvase-like predicted endonuclease
MSVATGRFFENKVRDYLKSQKHTIITSNFYSPFGEIDIITEKDSKIFFIEVKYLTKTNIINPIRKIDSSKLRRIFLSISYLKKFCKILNFQVDSYCVYFRNGKLIFECFPDLRLH